MKIKKTLNKKYYLIFTTFVLALLINVNTSYAQEVLEGVEKPSKTIQQKMTYKTEYVTAQLEPSAITKKAGSNDYVFSITINHLDKKGGGRYCVQKEDIKISDSHITSNIDNVLICQKTGNKIFFLIKEGYPGGDITIKIKFTFAYKSMDPTKGDVHQFSGNREFTIIYIGVPEIKNQAVLDKEAQQKLYAEVETEHKKILLEEKDLPDLKIAYGNKIHDKKTEVKKIKNINTELSNDRITTKELIERYNKLFEKLSEDKPNCYDAMTETFEYLKKRLETIKSLKTEISHRLAAENTALKENYTPIFQKQKEEIEKIEFQLNEWNGDIRFITKENSKEFSKLKGKYDELIKNFIKDNKSYIEDKKGLNDFPNIDALIENIITLQSKIDSNLIPDLQTSFEAEGFDPNSSSLKMPIIYASFGFLAILAIGIFFFIKQRKKNIVTKKEDAEDTIIDSIKIDVDDTEVVGEVFNLSAVTLTNYYEIDIFEQWERTLVSKCYIKNDVIETIYKFSRQAKKIKPVREVGGFLLGRYYKNHDSDYQIFIEKFIQPTVESESVYQIKFGTQAMHELDQALQSTPSMTLIGWFHTHPGHGIFLSKDDLNIHNGSFLNDYQVAIVIDPKTDNIDTGIFTRYINLDQAKKQTINPVHSRQHKKLFSWQDIRNSLSEQPVLDNKNNANNEDNAKSESETTSKKLFSNLPKDIDMKLYLKFDTNQIWNTNTKVSNVYFHEGILADIDIECKNPEKDVKDNKVMSFIEGYIVEQEDGKYDVYANKLINSTSDNKPATEIGEDKFIGWLGATKSPIRPIWNKIRNLHDNQKIEQPWQIAVVTTDNLQKIGIFTLNQEKQLNKYEETEHLSNFKEIQKWLNK